MGTFELYIKRFKTPNYCIGKLSINGVYFCDTLEDTDRGLKQTDSLEYIKSIKKNGETAIPTGRYRTVMNVVSPKYSNPKYTWAAKYGGKLPRLLNVPGFDGILIHVGNYPHDTEGCILVGKNTVKGAVMESTKTFDVLMPVLQRVDEQGDEIWITVE